MAFIRKCAANRLAHPDAVVINRRFDTQVSRDRDSLKDRGISESAWRSAAIHRPLSKTLRELSVGIGCLNRSRIPCYQSRYLLWSVRLP